MSSPQQKRVAVVGGSIAGLVAAVLLEQEGVDVTVFEKRADSNQEVGGGIVVQKPLRDTMARLCPGADVSVRVSTRQFLDEQGVAKSAIEENLEAGSWWSLWRPLRAAFKGPYRAGIAVTDILASSSFVTLTGDSDHLQQDFDFVIVADGGGSQLRAHLLGSESRGPEYAGYVAWRGVVPAEDLTPELLKSMVDSKVSFFHGDKTHILFYPIPVPGGVALNWVWYWNLPEGELHTLLKDSQVGRAGVFAVPPGMLGERAEAQLRSLAKVELPTNLCHIVEITPRPFLQSVVDYRAPRQLFCGGRVALIGDAACVLRPHTTFGTAKAAEEAEGLCAALLEGPGALQQWEAAALSRNEALARYGAFLGKSQQDKDAREKLRFLQGQKLDTSSSVDAVISACGGA